MSAREALARLTGSTSSRVVLAVALAAVAFLVLACPGVATRGLVSEEILPYLDRHPVVLETSHGTIAAMPPYEPGAPPPPRWVSTSQWPIASYDGTSRMWPVFIRGYQTAISSYVGLALRPILGGGVAGIRRATILLGLVVVVLTGVVAWRSNRASTAWAAALVGTSFGMVVIARTGYGFEVGSRAAMMVTLALCASRRPLRSFALVLAAAGVAVAILSRATIALALFPSMAVLLADRARRPRPASIALLAGIGVALPIVVVAVFALVVPFRSDDAAITGFALRDVPGRLAAVPRQLLIELAWLGDANSVFGPLGRGELTLSRSLWLPAGLAAIPVVAALVRAWRRRAGEGERMLLASLGASVVAGAVLYRDGNQFQLALALEPLIAHAVADQIASLMSTRATRTATLGIAVGAVAVGLRVQTSVRGLALDATNANPAFSGTAQHATIARLRELGVRGPELVTTVYNHAGVIEGWTDGAIRPLHAWPVLTSSDPCKLERAWRAILREYRPAYALFTDGPNLFEMATVEPAAIARAFDAVVAEAKVRTTAQAFATESGQPGWTLVALDYDGASPIRASDPECIDSARDAQRVVLESLHGVRPGDDLAGFVIEEIRASRPGAKPESTWVLARRGDVRVTFEVRPESDGPPPPGRGGGLAVFYRNDDVARVPADDLAAAAAALGERFAAGQ